MNLGDLYTTTVAFDEHLEQDEVIIDDQPAEEAARARVSSHLDLVCWQAGIQVAAHVVSRNNFPAEVGIASSASGFAALTVAACAAGLATDPTPCSSAPACR